MADRGAAVASRSKPPISPDASRDRPFDWLKAPSAIRDNIYRMSRRPATNAENSLGTHLNDILVLLLLGINFAKRLFG